MVDKVSVSEPLRGLMREHGLSLRKLAEKAGVELSTVQRALRPGTKNGQRPSTVASLAAVFGMTAGELERWVPPRTMSGSRADTLPLLSTVPAGRGDDMGVSAYEAEAHVSRSVFGGLTDPAAYLLTIRGDSMMPELAEGELVACSPGSVDSKGFVDGSMYVVRYGADDEATVKRVYNLNEYELELRPDNPRHRAFRLKQGDILHAARVVARVMMYPEPS